MSDRRPRADSAPARSRRPACRGAACSTGSAWGWAASRSPTSSTRLACSPPPRPPDQDRGVLGGQLHHAARAKRVIYLFMAGGPSQIETFDYKPAAHGAQRRAAAGFRAAGAAAHRDVREPGVAAARGLAVRVRPARQQWHVGVRLAAADGQGRRRPVHRPLHVHGCDQSRPRDYVLPDRLANRRPPQSGIVDSLRARQRQRQPSGLRGPDHTRQGGSAAVLPAVGQRVPAVPPPGRAVPERQGRRPVPDQSRRGDAREPPARCSIGSRSCTRTPPIGLATRRWTGASRSTRCRTACRRASLA